MHLKMKYVSREPSGLFLYHRRIPEDLREFYGGQRLHRQSLGTHDPGEASREALRLAKEDDEIWRVLRDGAQDIKSARAIIIEDAAIQIQDRALIRNLMKARAAASPPEPLFSEALGLYFRKHSEKDAKFVADTKRVFDFAKEVIGDRALSKIKRADARLVLDAMLARNWKTATVRRNMAVLSAIFNGSVYFSGYALADLAGAIEKIAIL